MITDVFRVNCQLQILMTMVLDSNEATLVSHMLAARNSRNGQEHGLNLDNCKMAFCRVE